VKSDHSNLWDIVVVGGASYDYYAQCNELPTAEGTQQASFYISYPSGKGVNQAVASARLGAKTAYIGKIGQDLQGDLILAELQNAGVNTDFVFRDSSENTGTNLIVADHKDSRQTVCFLGANEKLTKKEVLSSAAVLQSTKYLLVQLEIPKESAIASIQVAATSNAQIIFNPAPPIYEFSPEFFQFIDIIRLNSREAERLTGFSVLDRSSARLAAEKLLWGGVSTVIIQAGKEGSLLLWGEYEFWLPRLLVRSVDTSGAGDAFIAALAVSLVDGKSLTDSAIFANAAAALETTRLGAHPSLLSRAEVFAFLESVEPKKKQKPSSILKLVS
jgi:ribokinase